MTELYCNIDDFYKEIKVVLENKLLSEGEEYFLNTSRLSCSEVMAIMIHFHQIRYRDFKTYYTKYVMIHLKEEFPRLVSYNRFVELMKSIFMPLCLFVYNAFGEKTGIYFIDSTTLKACHSKREKSNKVFKGLAKKGKNSMGWFYGFKLHLVINDKGELMAFQITKGNVDDRVPVMDLCKNLNGKLFGDRGYISQKLFESLFTQGLQLVTKLKKKMKNKVMLMTDKVLLRKRAIIESVNDQLKNICQIEHSRHRSPVNFLVNLVSALAAYSLQEKKPSLNLKSHKLILA